MFQLAKQYHPDVNKGDATKSKRFQEVSEAYEVLSDAKKRQEYDMFGMHGAGSAGAGGGPGGFGGGQGFEQYQGNIDPEELFRTIFGQFGSRGGGGGGGFDFSNFGDFGDSFATPTQVDVPTLVVIYMYSF